ncbi:M3 family metallopeptidase [Corynebacterium aquilae]|uniref:Peptidase n=1 Tax=Corynebacterium aquilae DSM 44791 TaxID=1431546 RepID=A0A1L7CH69_9CORY|nr:M3 family metallopeptidase [Corynebacterium aquilae]APT85210.1 peptidase [Corynebacterium aquilae DSM 44791]
MNPLIAPSELPYQLPPFADIRAEHYLPAFYVALDDHDAEINAITTNPAEPTWENTVEALEKSGAALTRVENVFFNLHLTDGTDDFDTIAEEILPKLSAHADSIYQNTALFERIKAVEAPAGDEEGARLKDKLIRTFIRKGAGLNDEDKKTLSELNAQLASLSEQFGKNLRESTAAHALSVTADDVDGWTPARIDAAADAARSYNRDGLLIPLGLPAIQPDQTTLNNPATRRALMDASLARGEANTDVVLNIVALRARRAKLLGYDSHADYVIAEETARTVDAVDRLLRDLAPAASANAAGEYKLLAEEAESAHQKVTDADWPYWEAKVKKRDFALDEAELKNYFPLNQVVEDGVFFAAKRLYGIEVVPREDLEGYHEDVRVYEVKEADGSTIGLFLTDYYARPTKRGGAWMSSFVDQSDLVGTKPVIVNVMNLTKPADGSQPLLSYSQVTTVFHEFGHALHGLLSKVRYPTFAGTNVPRDYVEFPSQINENWALDPVVVRNYARHVDTGEIIGQDMLDAIEKAQLFGQGFATSEYLAAAIIDMAWHKLSEQQARAVTDIDEFERAALLDAGLDVEHLHARYKSRFFNHVFSGGYSAGYYSYLWAEALDADGFDWFTQEHAAGEQENDEAARAAGQRFRDLVLSAGGSRDFDEAFTTLRGREKDVAPLLARRGLGGAV